MICLLQDNSCLDQIETPTQVEERQVEQRNTQDEFIQKFKNTTDKLLEE